MTTLNDFFGDGGADNIPECSFCGSVDGELIVSASDAYGPTHWHHETCKDRAVSKKASPLVPTWDEAMENTICVCDFPNGSATVAQRKRMSGHYNEAGGFCCPHHGNTCGHCHQYDRDDKTRLCLKEDSKGNWQPLFSKGFM